MGKVSLLFAVFLFLAIIIALSGIFFLDHQKGQNQTDVSNLTSNTSAQGSAQSAFSISDDKTILNLTAKLKKVTEKNGTVTGELTFTNSGKAEDVQTVLYDGKTYSAYYLALPPDAGSTEENVQAYTDPNSILRETKKLEGQKIQLLFDIVSTKSKLICNKIFLNYLNKKINSLPCLPVAGSVSANVL